MLDYKGYTIPNTFEDIIEYNSNANRGIQTPYIQYNIPKTNIIINTTISIEDIANAKDDKKKEEIVNLILEVVKGYIDHITEGSK